MTTMGQDVTSEAGQPGREFRSFLLLAVFLVPALAIAFVGGLGLTIWIYQLLAGPPGPPIL